jgi:Rad3-related DNA helicase
LDLCYSYLEYKTHSEVLDRICDIEDLVKLGRTHSVCPYYLAKELQTSADIIFLPYNYIIDPVIRRTLTIALHNSILIFDEAHNLVFSPFQSFIVYNQRAKVVENISESRSLFVWMLLKRTLPARRPLHLI